MSTNAENATNRRRNSNQAETAIRSGIVTSPPPMMLRNVKKPVSTPLRTSSAQRCTMPSNSPMNARFVTGASVSGWRPTATSRNDEAHEQPEREPEGATMVGQHRAGEPIPRTAARRRRTR